MIRILTKMRERLATMMMEATSIGSTPRNVGRGRKRKMITTVRRSEGSQHRNACSKPSSRSEACTAMMKIARNQTGPRGLMRIKKPI